MGCRSALSLVLGIGDADTPANPPEMTNQTGLASLQLPPPGAFASAATSRLWAVDARVRFTGITEQLVAQTLSIRAIKQFNAGCFQISFWKVILHVAAKDFEPKRYDVSQCQSIRKEIE
jgi:hypothetical protein